MLVVAHAAVIDRELHIVGYGIGIARTALQPEYSLVVAACGHRDGQTQRAFLGDFVGDYRGIMLLGTWQDNLPLVVIYGIYEFIYRCPITDGTRNSITTPVEQECDGGLLRGGELYPLARAGCYAYQANDGQDMN